MKQTKEIIKDFFRRENHIKKLKSMFEKKLNSLNWVFGFCFFIALALAILWTPPSSQEIRQQKPLNLDTFIPKGHVLIPIEVENLGYLRSTIGQYGKVSLYKNDKKVIGRIFL